MTLLDAMRLFGLSAPITHDIVDRACMEALWRVWGPVHQAPGDAALAAQAQLWDGEIRRAHALLRERPLNLYPYQVVTPAAAHELPPGLGAGAFPSATSQTVAVQPQVFPAQAQLPVQPQFTAQPPPLQQFRAQAQPPPLPPFPAQAVSRPGAATPPPPPLYRAPLRGQPQQAPQRRLSGWTWVALGAAALVVCGVGFLVYAGLTHTPGSGKSAFMPGAGIGAGAGVGVGYSEGTSSSPASAQRERQRGVDAAAAAVDGSGLRSDHHSLDELSKPATPAPAPAANAPAKHSQGQLSRLHGPDGSIVARMQDGTVVEIGPTASRRMVYGPEGSPFGNKGTPSSTMSGPPQAGGKKLSPSERLARLPEQYRRMVAGEEELRQKLLAKAEKGDVEAQYRLAEYYANPSSFTADMDAAFHWYRKAADAGYGPAQLALAKALTEGPPHAQKNPEEAAVYFRKAAAQGGTESLAAYGKLLLHGALNVPADPDAAISYLQRAAEKGHAESQYLLGHEMINPYGKLTNYPEGLRLLEESSAQDYGMATYELACTYLDGTGRPADPDRGVQLLQDFIEKHPYPIAIIKLADCYRDGLGVPRDYRYAASIYMQWQTLPCAQYRLSLMHHFGRGVPKDEVQALKWLELSSACGHAPALFEVGMRHATGLGLDKDDIKAAEAFQQAALQHYAPAETELGLCYLDGRGVGEDQAQGIHYLLRAAAVGFPKAQENLGHCYARGRGVAKDPAQAAEWLTRAAAQDYGPAQITLGRFLLESRPGHPADLVQALAWFLRAEALEEGSARDCVQSTREQLPPQDIAEAMRRLSRLPQSPKWKDWQPF